MALDASGVGNDGAVFGASYTSGVAQTALRFDGNNDRVVVSDHASLDLPGDFSISAWLRPDRQRTQYVIKKARYGSVDGYELSLSGSSGTWFARFNQASLGNTYKITSTSPYPTDGSTWMHVAVTYDGQDIRLYTNGSLERIVSAPGLALASNGVDLGLGAQDDGSQPFDGALDQVRIHDVALAPQQIAELITIDTLPELESWTTWSVEAVDTTETTGEKPQAKVWQRDGLWWAVFPDSLGTWLWQLDGEEWTPVLQLSTSTGVNADIEAGDGALVHVLLVEGAGTELSSLEWVPGAPGTYQLWSARPNRVPVPVSGSAETATLALDTSGRLWVAYDTSSTVRVRYADPADQYSSWSNAITVASGVTGDDIGAITAFDGRVGLFWSNQATQRFGFRFHFDGDDPALWSADEVPGDASALAAGNGMADDHMNLAALSDGTLYAAVKTSYDTPGLTAIGLLVRRPDGTWDDFYEVDTVGTRPLVAVNEALGQLVVVYTQIETGGDIEYRISDADDVSFGPRLVLMPGTDLNNPSSLEGSFLDELIVIAATAAPDREIHTISLAP